MINTGGKQMNILPRADNVVIPRDKFTKYALNPQKSPNKALAFELALGYNLENVDKLIANIEKNLKTFPAKHKGDKGYGSMYEVVLNLVGENGKTAKVLTGWIDDKFNGEVRLTTVHID